MATAPTYRSFAEFDDKARVFVIDASTVPGLTAEAGDLSALYEAVAA